MTEHKAMTPEEIVAVMGMLAFFILGYRVGWGRGVDWEKEAQVIANEEIAALIAKAIETEDDKVSNAEDFDYEYSFDFHYADCARAVLTALSNAGFVVVPRERAERIVTAGLALIADVRARYPGEDLRCPFMIGLDAALSAYEENTESAT